MDAKAATRHTPMLKSLLFVPGDSEMKMGKACTTAASALILDLEDALAIERLDVVRGMVRAFLASHGDRGRQQLWVRVNPLTGPLALSDLVAVVPGAPDGILVPKVESARDIVALDHYLTAL